MTLVHRSLLPGLRFPGLPEGQAPHAHALPLLGAGMPQVHFLVQKSTVMQSFKLGSRKWLIAVYILSAGLKGAACRRLCRELCITQNTEWFLAQRIHEWFQ